MKINIMYAKQKISVTIISFAPESATTIPPAGVHPVVQAKGKMVSLLSPIDLQPGLSFLAESGFEIPYTVHIQSCMDDLNGQFHVLGVIG